MIDQTRCRWNRDDLTRCTSFATHNIVEYWANDRQGHIVKNLCHHCAILVVNDRLLNWSNDGYHPTVMTLEEFACWEVLES